MIGSILSDRRGMSPIGVAVVIVVLLAVAAGVGILVSCYTGFGRNVREVFQPPFNGKRQVFILLLGEDDTGIRNKARGLSDTIILISIDLDTKYVAAISIPRDTRVDLDGYGGMCKINSAHVHGGPTLVELAVSGLTGIRPDYYVKTNVSGFKGLVDALGGVQIDVDRNMRYNDNWGNLHINLKKGLQTLNGEQAVGYVRFRHEARGDLARIERQQKFIKALVKKAIAPQNLPKLPWTVKAFLKNVETDMSPSDVLYLAKFASQIDVGQVNTEIIPGIPESIGGISYLIPNMEQIPKVVQDTFFPKPPMPKVEVLNGSGKVGAAQTVANTLKEYGYEIVNVGNADSFEYASTQIISHKKDLPGADQLPRIVYPSTMTTAEDPAAKAEITIIVGKDCTLINTGI